MDDDSEYKKAKGTKKGVIKRMFKFKNYKNCCLDNENHIKITTKIQKRANANIWDKCISSM